jgi:hypothetical protein
VVEDTWDTRARPILELVNALPPLNVVSVGDIATQTGLDPNDVVSELEMLMSGRYLDASFSQPLTGGDVRPWSLVRARVLERGARKIGRWPTDNPYDDLLSRLDRIISAEPDVEKRTRFERFRDGVLGVGKDVGTELLTAFVKAHAGLPS